MTTTASRFATLALTLVMSATAVLSAVGPATRAGSFPVVSTARSMA